MYPEWRAAADEQAGRLRRALTVWSHEASVRDLVDELLDDPEFEVRWHAHPVDEKRRGTKVLAHPEVGDLAIAYEVLDVADDSGQQLVTWLPADDATAARLDDAHRLAAPAARRAPLIRQTVSIDTTLAPPSASSTVRTSSRSRSSVGTNSGADASLRSLDEAQVGVGELGLVPVQVHDLAGAVAGGQRQLDGEVTRRVRLQALDLGLRGGILCWVRHAVPYRQRAPSRPSEYRAPFEYAVRV